MTDGQEGRDLITADLSAARLDRRRHRARDVGGEPPSGGVLTALPPVPPPVGELEEVGEDAVAGRSLAAALPPPAKPAADPVLQMVFVGIVIVLLIVTRWGRRSGKENRDE